MADKKKKDSSTRGNASQFFIAGELCRRGYSAVVTLGNTPNVDILCSNLDGTRFAHIQVKTFVPSHEGKKSKTTCSVGMKATKPFGESFFWVLGGIPKPTDTVPFVYYVIPSEIMATNVNEAHKMWLADEGKDGHVRQESTVRTVAIPPHKSYSGWDISEFKNRWDLIEKHLNEEPPNTDSPATDAA
ncbi:hypothetical protein BH09VER1_BH09VER1_29760 [soil metagenome]